jgi:hypothetical protein
LALIESGNNPNAVSSAGARGLYQLMPETAAKPGFKVKPLSTGSDIDAAPVEEQRRFSKDYLSAMLKRYDGDLALALAAYNGGAGRVDDYIKDGKALPAETVEYVQKFVNQGQVPQENSVSSGKVVEPSSGPGLVSRVGTAIGQALSSPAQAAPLPDSMLPPGFRSTDSQGRPFIRPEAGAEVTESSMLGSLISSVRSALNLGSDEEAQSVAEKLMQSGIIPRRPEGLSGDEPMRLPPVRPTEQEMAEANQLTPSEQRIADSREKVEARRVFNVALNKAASEENTPNFVESTITGLSEAIGLGVMGEAFINDIVSKQLPSLNSWRKTTLTEENLDPDELSVMQKLYEKVGLGKVNYADYGADASIGLKGKNRNKSNLFEIMGYGAEDRTQKTFGEGTFVKEGKDIFFVDQYDHNFYTVFNEGEKLKLISPEEYEKSGRSVREDLLTNYKAYSEDEITMFQLMHNVGFLLGSRDYKGTQKDSSKKIKIKVN